MIVYGILHGHDGRKGNPIVSSCRLMRMSTATLITGFYRSQVVQDFSHQQYDTPSTQNYIIIAAGMFEKCVKRTANLKKKQPYLVPCRP